jgi:hypothetical protein
MNTGVESVDVPPVPVLGLARLMTMAFEGQDLAPLGRQLIERARADTPEPEALLDLSIVLQRRGERSIGLAAQADALRLRRLYEWPAAREASLRLLVLMAPGDLMTNTPLDFLLQDSDIALRVLYLLPGEPLPEAWPAHDAVFIAISDSQATRPLLVALAACPTLAASRVVNRAAGILRTSRERAHACLSGVPGLWMPPTAAASRGELQHALQQDATGARLLADLLRGASFPLIVRPLDSHAGHELERVADAPALQAYLDASAAAAFYLSPFVDYRDPDGQFRKFRVVLIDGQPHAAHLGISSHWMVHYLNAGMTESAVKRAEEAAFMRDFDTGFGARHAAALQAVAQRLDLDYLVIDCAQAPDGRLLVFEVDPGAVVHDMDPPGLFPYKPPQMAQVFAAFRRMLRRHAGHVGRAQAAAEAAPAQVRSGRSPALSPAG